MELQPQIKTSLSKIEYRSDTRYTAVSSPRLSWLSETATPGWLQAWAELECDGTTVRIEGRDSVLVEWPFAPLNPREVRKVRVRVGGEDGSVSPWSEPHTIEAGFLNDGDWTAEMISLPATDRVAQPGQFRTSFTVEGRILKATLYSTAQGVYQVGINGHAVDDETLKPGWTAYQWRLIHETTDVTALVKEGANAIGLQLTGGWYCERYGFGEDAVPFYGAQPAAALMLVIEKESGATQIIQTDSTWRSNANGPVVDAGIYGGQHDDARLDQPGWTTADFHAASWETVRTESSPVPLARIAPPVRQIAELHAVKTSTAPSGAVILDFGQNISGRLRVRADLPEGTKAIFKHAEILDGTGELDRASMGAAATTDSFISAGTPTVWEPEFTFRGFRYASVEGWVGELPDGAITAVAISSDLTRTAWLETSNELVNKLHESTVWSMRDNFVSLPTDCPQRAERLGWTGDIMWFSPTGATLFDVDGFLVNWLADLKAEQVDSGVIVPFVIPAPISSIAAAFSTPAAAWGDASTVVPSVLYDRYADVQVIRSQYESMTAWVDHIASLAGESRLWKGGFQFGDWLDPFTPPEFPTEAKADAELVATAYFYNSARLLSEMAAALGNHEDQRRYRQLAEEVKAAFNAEYVTRNGRITSEAQTAYALAIVFGLAEDEQTKQQMGAHLANLVREGGYHIGTGFAGTPYLTEALTSTGHIAAADRMLMQTECPSWLYPITKGATTTWEAWDSLRPDGTPSPRSTSFNHYAFGSVVDWLYRTVAGIGPAQPGYRSIRIAPQPLPSLNHVQATHLTPYGKTAIAWTRVGEQIRIEATVPPNTTAEVHLPGEANVLTVGSGKHTWTVKDIPATSRVHSLSLQTDLASIIQDPDAYAAVLESFDRHVPRAAEALRTHHTHWKLGEPLEVSIFTSPTRVRNMINEDLAKYTPRDN